MIFKENSYGGIDIYNEKQKFLLHLSDDEINTIRNMQQKSYYLNWVKETIPEWVDDLDNDNDFLADFNSHLYSNDEIAINDIVSHILSDEHLIQEIAKDLEENENEDFSIYEVLNDAISIEDVLGEILREKYPKEFHIGKWRVAVVEKGDFYGLNGALQYENDKPIVDFYDMSQDKERFPDGQFTGGQYYIETLLTTNIYSSSITVKAKQGIGLSLHGDVPSWTVAPGELAVIGAWLQAVQKHYELKFVKSEPSLENTLMDAQERSQKENNKDAVLKDGLDKEI